MTHVIDDFQSEKKRLKTLAYGNIIVVLICLSITLACYYANQLNVCIFFGVITGLTSFFLLVVLAERLELNNIMETSISEVPSKTVRIIK